MATTQYKVAQPTHLDDNFDDLSSSANQFNKIFIDLRKQRYYNDHSSWNDNMQQTSIGPLSQQRLEANTVNELNNPRHVTRPAQA